MLPEAREAGLVLAECFYHPTEGIVNNYHGSGEKLHNVIPVNRPYLGGTVPLLLPLSHHPTFTPFCPTFTNPLQLTTK